MMTNVKNVLKISMVAGAMAVGIFTVSNTTFAAELQSETQTTVQAEHSSGSLELGLLNEVTLSGDLERSGFQRNRDDWNGRRYS